MSPAVVEDTREAFKVDRRPDGLAILEFDLPGEKVNKLTTEVLLELEGVLKEISEDSSIRAVIFLSGKEESINFIAGADIREIEEITIPAEASEKARSAQLILNKLSEIPQPVIAVIHGACLGGGCELALACDYRVATDHPKTLIGLPEVKLGIIPGFGGTQRMPRLVGLQSSLDLILTGKMVDARKAARIGLVDHVVAPTMILPEVIAFTEGLLQQKGNIRKPKKRGLVQKFLEGTAPGRKIMRSVVLKNLKKKVSKDHYPAPYKAVDAIFKAVESRLSEGLQYEADLVGPLIVSDTSKHLISIFFDSEKLRRGEGEESSSDSTPHDEYEKAATRIGVLGAGVMGGGIAALLARKGGYHVRLKDIQMEAISLGLKQAYKSFEALVKRRRLTPQSRDNLMSAISGTVEPTGFADTDTVIEAVVEDMKIKQAVLKEIEPLLPEDAIFATNTSSLSIDELAEVSQRPENVAGLHFFNPVHRMPLVEVIRGEKTSEETVSRLEELSRKLGKYPLRVANAPGFLVNRLLLPYLNEAAYLFEEGYRMEAIDDHAKKFGLPMGPFELMDEVGLDVGAKVAKYLHEQFGDRARPAALLKALCDDEKLLGKKGGEGFYIYKDGKKRNPNPLVFKYGGKGSLDDNPDYWIRRMLAPLINEAARCLDEGIIEAGWQIDIGMVFGTGFPPFRGGPLRWADSVGVDNLASFLKEQAREYDGKGGERFQPSDYLTKLVEEKKGFYS